MAALGNGHKLYIKIADAYTWLAGEQNHTLDQTRESVEITDKGSEWKKFIYGSAGATISATIFADADDPAQKAAIEALHKATMVDYFSGVLAEAGTPTEGLAGQAIITGISDANNVGAVITRTINLTNSGEPTPYPAEA